jgi:hypothetical protein
LRHENEKFLDWYMRVVDEAIQKHGTKAVQPEIPPDYENPRGLPEAWLRRYLSIDRAQLALDVIKAFDKNYQLERANAHLRVTVWVMSLIVSPVIGEIVKYLLRPLLK